MTLSICIPTYNRSKHLENCLNSIMISARSLSGEIEVCISDNASTDRTESVVASAKRSLNIAYKKNKVNLGIPQNFLNVVNMARGEFVWLIGDDDLLMPSGIADLIQLINTNSNTDFFYVNAYHLTTEYVLSQKQPFNTLDLQIEMEPFSKWEREGEVNFFELVNPKISFDFLGGMFLSVFRRENWLRCSGSISRAALNDMRTFSYFDNTFPHLKIFSQAFSRSKAYFNQKPLIVCLTGAREWAPMEHLVRSVRLVEALEEYRKNGLPFWQYLKCKNNAVSNFLPALGYMFLNKNTSGYQYINPLKLTANYCLFPGFYMSVIYFIVRKFKSVLIKSMTYWRDYICRV
ncbi:MAG: glycosyltransferase [Gammaproteobacteria bacterium]|nr:glycosyltransferase [Gammaproteobacteria bacterium]